MQTIHAMYNPGPPIEGNPFFIFHWKRKKIWRIRGLGDAVFLNFFFCVIKSFTTNCRIPSITQTHYYVMQNYCKIKR